MPSRQFPEGAFFFVSFFWASKRKNDEKKLNLKLFMNKNLFSKLILILFFLPVFSFADSPLTSTHICDAYSDVDMVVKAEKTGKVTRSITDFLLSKDNSIDEKAAVINAVGWKFEGTDNAEKFCKYAYDKPLSEIKTDGLTSDELFCIGYLQALGDYFKPDKALPYLEAAHKKDEQSLTVALILALVKAQNIMDKGDWCKMWEITWDVLDDKSLYQDMREGAKKIIEDYMILYKC
jgi:hypothetical protein